ncbi:MAG: type II toxin-antitoxin system RelE/ParE family toxin [Gelidibacter sp.]
MVDEVRYDDDAIRELHRAKCFFDSIDMGEAFLDDLETQIELISSMPYAFQVRYRDVRIIKFDNFSYTIHYTFAENKIIILNILNQFQDF